MQNFFLFSLYVHVQLPSASGVFLFCFFESKIYSEKKKKEKISGERGEN